MKNKTKHWRFQNWRKWSDWLKGARHRRQIIDFSNRINTDIACINIKYFLLLPSGRNNFLLTCGLFHSLSLNLSSITYHCLSEIPTGATGAIAWTCYFKLESEYFSFQQRTSASLLLKNVLMKELWSSHLFRALVHSWPLWTVIEVEQYVLTAAGLNTEEMVRRDVIHTTQADYNFWTGEKLQKHTPKWPGYPPPLTLFLKVPHTMFRKLQ